MIIASKQMHEYFKQIEEQALKEYEIASKARGMGFEPKKTVEIALARNIGERVEGLMAAIFKQIKGSGVAERILELEKQYAPGDWRVAFKIGEECANGKFIKLKDKIELLDLGVRTGLAYLTQGTVSAPLEGVIAVKAKKRKDGKEYIAVYYAGPIRAAGGTPMTVSVVLTDYLRTMLGYDAYDPTSNEIKRYCHELQIYHERVARLQYFPTEQEVDFLVKHIPVEINGSPTTQTEVMIYKDADRVETTQIRGGMCLVLAEGIAYKAKKLSGGLKKFMKEFKLEHWNFLDEFLEIQKKQFSQTQKDESNEKIKPSYKYLKDAVAGRPIISYPSHPYGFRIRYGRTRVSGVEAYAFNPAVSYVLNNFLAVGTQLSIERPGKGCSVTFCEILRGPTVLLNNGNVSRVDSAKDYEKCKGKIKRILALGDVLINYGAFAEHKHLLVPSPYVEEWWIQELRREYPKKKVFIEEIKELFNNPYLKISYTTAKKISQEYSIPLHPEYVYYWKLITPPKLLDLIKHLENSIIQPLNNHNKLAIKNEEIIKIILEDLLIPHDISVDMIIFDENASQALLDTLGYENNFNRIKKALEENINNKEINTLQIINQVAPFKIMDTVGYTMGARMGRPEKAKMRKMKSSPHLLFPVGEQGGRLRSINNALEEGYVKTNFPIYYCNKCNSITIYGVCEKCNNQTKEWRICTRCRTYTSSEEHCNTKTSYYEDRMINLKQFIDAALKRLRGCDNSNFGQEHSTIPQLLKGVRGVSNEKRVLEILEKGILRATNNVYVNKDGTIRIDLTEVPVTHFKPKEIMTSISKLKQLGYKQDIHGNELADEEQILELKPQDVILPNCKELAETDIAKEVMNITKFLDDLLTRVYCMPKYYNIKTINDIAGVLCIALAPHTSAGTLARIIGFSKNQGGMAHPLMHSACRRDCFDKNTSIVLNINGKITTMKIGDFVEKNLIKPEKIDSFGTIKDEVNNVYAYGINEKNKKLELKKVKSVIKGRTDKWVKIKTHLGRELLVTSNHNHLYIDKNQFKIKKAEQAGIGDRIPMLTRSSSQEEINKLLNYIKQGKGENEITQEGEYTFDIVKSVEIINKDDFWYCIDVEGRTLTDKNILLTNNLLQVRCDGDEVGLLLLLDGFLNFSHEYLPDIRGTKNMDAPLVLALTLDTSVIDDEVYDMDVAWSYPIELYEATQQYKEPSEVQIEQVKHRLEKPLQYEQYGYTHPVDNFNNGIMVSSYKTLPTMDEKVEKQMDLAFKVRAIKSSDVATLVIERHFLRDIKGNLRKFSMQQFRCVNCNEKFRRIPLKGACPHCNGKIILTIHEGSVIKYMQQCSNLAKKYDVHPYIKQSIELLEKRIESVFGKDKEKQESLKGFFSQ